MNTVKKSLTLKTQINSHMSVDGRPIDDDNDDYYSDDDIHTSDDDIIEL